MLLIFQGIYIHASHNGLRVFCSDYFKAAYRGTPKIISEPAADS